MATAPKSVQFNDPRKVIDAYKKQDIPAWGLFVSGIGGMQLITKYQGEDIKTGEQALKFWVNNFQLDGTSAIYTLCFYEDVPATGIKNNTPYDGSFNFRFYEKSVNYLPADIHAQVGGGYDKLYDKFNEVSEQLKVLQERMDEEPEEQKEKLTLTGVLLEQIKPGIPLLMQRLVALIPLPGEAGTNKPTHLSGIVINTRLSEDERIQVAVAELRSHVPNLAELLEKLALMREKQEVYFNMYMEQLLKMNF